LREKIRTIPDNWIRILWFVSTLANSFGGNERRPGRKAISGCLTIIGLFREALHEVYIPRIQRGNASFAANALGVRGALLAVLVHFFENLRWDSLVEMGLEEQSLTADDRFFILAQAATVKRRIPAGCKSSSRADLQAFMAPEKQREKMLVIGLLSVCYRLFRFYSTFFPAICGQVRAIHWPGLGKRTFVTI
jgi:hypothetical protein